MLTGDRNYTLIVKCNENERELLFPFVRKTLENNFPFMLPRLVPTFSVMAIPESGKASVTKLILNGCVQSGDVET
jgi:hypothetical protein